MGFKIVNLDGFVQGLKDKIEANGEKVEKTLAKVVFDYIQELDKNIPVWSGRTLSSVRVSTTGEVAPLRGDPSPEEAKQFGRTREMPLGSEPMREPARQVAEAQARRAEGFKIGQTAYITVHSEAWGLVEEAKAPTPDAARNKAVVSAIAKQRILTMHKTVKG